MILRNTFSALLLLLSCFTFAQKWKKADKAVIANLETHIRYLAADKLEGRRAGTNGEKLAMEYISGQFQQIGLSPRGDNDSFIQPFDIFDGKEIAKGTFLSLNGNSLAPQDFFPLMGSPDASLEAAPAIALQEPGLPWFLDLKEELDSNRNNPHFDLRAYIEAQAAHAAKKTATALLVYNSGGQEDALKFDGKEKAAPLPLPVIYIAKAIARKYFKDEAATINIKMKLGFTDKKRVGHNVVGYLDNGAANMIILGAHFDHLGYGEDNNSMYRGPEKLIHNGADDNASGTAALIELARLLKNSKLKKSNFLFVAFSGEELGLFGSKYFVDHPTVPLSAADYMINMDMVGRLNDSTRSLTIGGYGTSPQWGPLLSNLGKDPYFTNKYDSSGTGPSDHTSFYRKDIPVLFFFTGIHPDYHRPTDDAEKINYTGEYRIIRYIYRILENTQASTRLAFSKTRETSTTGSSRFSVTMGIMPDYAYSGNGVRVDGVSDGRPAQKAGLRIGDVVIQLGEFPVLSVENYMQVLGKFKKGDKAKVKLKRGNDTIETEVTF